MNVSLSLTGCAAGTRSGDIESAKLSLHRSVFSHDPPSACFIRQESGTSKHDLFSYALHQKSNLTIMQSLPITNALTNQRQHKRLDHACRNMVTHASVPQSVAFADDSCNFQQGFQRALDVAGQLRHVLLSSLIFVAIPMSHLCQRLTSTVGPAYAARVTG